MERHVYGRITSGLQPDTLTMKTIEFVYKRLPTWRDYPSRPHTQDERQLNQQLCNYLNSKDIREAYPMVQFNHEQGQAPNRSVDIGVSLSEDIEEYDFIEANLSIFKPFLVFECKRLPAPSRNREMEYVTSGVDGTKGGIQRFKLGLHGGKFNVAGMIAYIQDGSTSEWLTTINNWITNLSQGTIPDMCIWNTNELLKEYEEILNTGMAKCLSINQRINSNLSDKIKLYHLWIVMNERINH